MTPARSSLGFSRRFSQPRFRALAAGTALALAAGAGLPLWSAPRALAGGDACEAAERAAREARAPAPAKGLVVHEWGTFTSVQGSDGVTLDGLQHEEEALPGFVHSHAATRHPCAFDRRFSKGMDTAQIAHVTEKMETPVTYFYSDIPRRVRASVTFERGVLSQWYPRADLDASAVPPGDDLDMAKVARTRLAWDVDVLPRGEGEEALPDVKGGDPWAFARLAGSNAVRAHRDLSSRGSVDGAAAPDETEKFLFYRGLGSFTLPIQARTAPGARVTLRNDGAEAIRHVFLVHVAPGAGGKVRGRWAYAPEVPARGEVTLEGALDAKEAASVDEMIASLRPALEKSLVEAGLFQGEAEAMTRTWERSYFRSEGLRALYVVPDAQVKAILPLEVEPAPERIARVLVGRLECIAPETEKEVAAALVDLYSKDEEGKRSARGLERLHRTGRFLEPAVRRVLAMEQYAGAHGFARDVLASVESYER